MPSLTNTAAVGTRPEQPSGTAHPHMGPAPGPTGSPAPQPQTPPGASTRGRQPAASRAAAKQAHPEPRPRDGPPDRPKAGQAYAQPKGTPKQTRIAAPTDTTMTRPSGTVHPHAHNPTESPNPQALATPSATAPGHHLQAPAEAEPASGRHHAPPAGPAVRPTEPSSPSRPAPNPSPGPDPNPAHATVPADTPRCAGRGSLPGPPPRVGRPRPRGGTTDGRRSHAARTASPATTRGAHGGRHRKKWGDLHSGQYCHHERRAHPEMGGPSGGVEQPAIQHADPPDSPTNGSGEALTAGQPDAEPEEPMPDAGHEACLHP